MRITKFYQMLNWPIMVRCEDCEIEISQPNDMTIRREVCTTYVDETPVSVISLEEIVVECPICGTLHKLPRQLIPDEIYQRIPVSYTQK